LCIGEKQLQVLALHPTINVFAIEEFSNYFSQLLLQGGVHFGLQFFCVFENLLFCCLFFAMRIFLQVLGSIQSSFLQQGFHGTLVFRKMCSGVQ